MNKFRSKNEQSEPLPFMPIPYSQQTEPYHHRIPPYSKLGDPYIVTKHNLAYSQNSNEDSSRWLYLQKENITIQLNKCFPFLYVITHGLALIVHSVIQIGLQLPLLADNGALNYVAQGIWGGLYFLITGIFTILLSILKNWFQISGKFFKYLVINLFLLI